MAVVWSYPLLPFDTAAGSAVTAAALTAGTPTPQPVSPPIQEPGTAILIEVNGEVTCTSTTPTVVLGIYVGAQGNAIGSQTSLGTTASLAFSASASAWPFTMRYMGTVRSLSTSSTANGVIHGQGYCFWWGNVGLTGTPSINIFPTTQAARTISTINTYANLQFDVGVTLSATTGSPSVTITDFDVEFRG